MTDITRVKRKRRIWMRSNGIKSLFGFVLILSTVSVSDSHETYATKTPNARQYPSDMMYKCADDSDSDCIEKLEIVDALGVYKELEFVRMWWERSWEVTYQDQTLELQRQGEQVWQVRGTNTEYFVRTILIDSRSKFDERVFVRISTEPIGRASSTDVVRFNALVRTRTFFGKVQMQLRESTFSITRSLDGYRYSVSGLSARTPQAKLIPIGTVFTPSVPPVDKAAYSTVEWRFDLGKFYWYDIANSRCTEGLVIATSTGFGVKQSPKWDGSQLTWKLGGPRYWEDGPLIYGNYETAIPTSLFKCAYGLEENMIPTGIEIELRDDDGVQQLSTTTVGVRDGYVSIKIYGFHFSTVNFTLKSATNARAATTTTLPSSTSSPSPKKAIAKLGARCMKLNQPSNNHKTKLKCVLTPRGLRWVKV